MGQMIGIRRAIVLLLLSFYALQLGATAWLGPEEMTAAMAALAACYLLAFFGVAAEWFWARWFAIGLGNFGSLMLLVMFKVGYEPIFAIIGGTHLAITVLMSGEGMAAYYEYSPRAQERYNFEQESLATLRKAVKSAGSTLPILILYGLAPGEEALNLLVLGAGLVGIWGLLQQRTWSLLPLAAAGGIALCDGLGWLGAPTNGALLFLAGDGTPIHSVAGSAVSTHMMTGTIVGLLSGGLLIVPLLYARPLYRYWRKLPA